VPVGSTPEIGVAENNRKDEGHTARGKGPNKKSREVPKVHDMAKFKETLTRLGVYDSLDPSQIEYV
jgi:hypothetical protein